jgi:hypothetical protein
VLTSALEAMVGRLWVTRGTQRLGAWVASEEAPKPMRGFREYVIYFRSLEREDPEVPPNGQGHGGSV